jgi:hypothetical protein
MIKYKTIALMHFIIAFALLFSCSSSEGIKNQIIGKYASSSENEYDNFKDTLEIRLLDDGRYDVQRIANWSAAKSDDPERPNKNKKAGVWNNYGSDRPEVASFQSSDTTLRITQPVTGEVDILFFKSEGKILERKYTNGEKTIYHRVFK